MKKETLLTIISTIICILTMLIFLAFSSRLPGRVPVQITVMGSVGNTLPKYVVIFVLPLVFALINLFNSFKLNKVGNSATYKYFIVPFVSIAATIATILFSIYL